MGVKYAPVEIWQADWTFFELSKRDKDSGLRAVHEVVVKKIVTKRIPIMFLALEELSFVRALEGVLGKAKRENLIKVKGIYKVKINYIKKLGYVNGSSMENIY